MIPVAVFVKVSWGTMSLNVCPLEVVYLSAIVKVDSGVITPRSSAPANVKIFPTDPGS